MLFNSYIFILYFFPVVCILYYLVRKQNKLPLRNLLLLAASLAFYAYAGIESCIIILIITGINYLYYFLIHNSYKSRIKHYLVILGVGTDLMVLIYFKYYNFFVDNINLFLRGHFSGKEIIAPLGISFIIFQQIAFLVDAGRNEIEKCGVIEYFIYTLFFPHVSSGPILIHNDFLPLLRDRCQVNWNSIASGIYMFVMGLGKKVLVADMLAKSVDWGYANLDVINTTSAVWISVLYTLQIYFDFSGYSDMAIGISRMLQLDLPINFNSPYKSKTILEFWDRWHITLTRFFTKYLYIPLGGNRKGTCRTYINTMLVFTLSGLWHGAGYTFILWGLLHGGFMVITKRFIKAFNKLPDWMNQVITLFFINFTWILFRSGSLRTFRAMMRALAKFEWGKLDNNICQSFVPTICTYFHIDVSAQICAVVITIILIFIVLRCRNVKERADDSNYTVLKSIISVLVMVLCILSLGGINSFIYMNF